MLEAPAIPRHILLVGPRAHQLAAALAPSRLTSAASLLEAVLVSQPSLSLILVDVAPETDHLESAIRSLRGINPNAHIVLLCDPVHEVSCRRALSWGADQYEIMPVDGRTVEGFLQPKLARPRREMPAASGAVTNAALTHHDEVTFPPALPLLVQTELLEEILEGAGLRPDFAQRATEALKRHMGIAGTLRFLPGEAPEQPLASRERRQEVAFTGQSPYGTLTWQPDPANMVLEPPTVVLTQAASWLAAMLALAQRYEQLRTLAITDELSGAYNRRYFTKFMSGLLERARENRFRVTLLLFDIDDFKKYNDQFGHASGDAIIRELVKLLRVCTRTHDLVARVGGDEFAVVYWDNEAPRQPNSDHPKDVLVATERFREAIRNHRWPETCKIKGTISISGGLATFPWHARSLDTLLAKADEALLQAKAAGKNVIVMTPAQPTETVPPLHTT